MAADFSPSNDAPASISTVAGAPADDAPAAKTVGAAPDNTAPVAIGAVSNDGIANPPDAIARGDVNPDNTAPGAVTVAGMNPDNTEPVALVPGVPVPDNTAPSSLTPLVPPGSNEPPKPMPIPVLPAATDNTVNTPTIQIGDMFELNGIYGQTLMHAPGSIVRVQAQLMEAPIGADAKIALVDSDNNPVGIEITVPVGTKFGTTLAAGSGLAYLAGATFKAKVTQIGSDANAPGGYAVVTLHTQLAA